MPLVSSYLYGRCPVLVPLCMLKRTAVYLELLLLLLMLPPAAFSSLCSALFFSASCSPATADAADQQPASKGDGRACLHCTADARQNGEEQLFHNWLALNCGPCCCRSPVQEATDLQTQNPATALAMELR